MFESMTVSRVRSEYALVFGRDVLSPLLFIIFMDRISRRSTTSDCVTMGNARVESLLFADYVARLASSGAGLQRALDRFAAECTIAGVQITTEKTEVMVLSR